MLSIGKWSNGTDTEHSIANAYANIIRQANHFIYIENQFFITATGTKQNPVKNNLIGSALVERILRAARSGQDFKVICVIPAIPGFAGDLKEDASLGTRAIMVSVSEPHHHVLLTFPEGISIQLYQQRRSLNHGGDLQRRF